MGQTWTHFFHLICLGLLDNAGDYGYCLPSKQEKPWEESCPRQGGEGSPLGSLAELPRQS